MNNATYNAAVAKSNARHVQLSCTWSLKAGEVLAWLRDRTYVKELGVVEATK